MEERRGLRLIGGRRSELGRLGVVQLFGEEGGVNTFVGLAGGVEIALRYMRSGTVAGGTEIGGVEFGLDTMGREVVLVVCAAL